MRLVPRPRPPLEPQKHRFWDAISASGLVISSNNELAQHRVEQAATVQRDQCKLASEYFGDDSPSPAAEQVHDDLTPLMLETLRRCAKDQSNE